MFGAKNRTANLSNQKFKDEQKEIEETYAEET